MKYRPTILWVATVLVAAHFPVIVNATVPNPVITTAEQSAIQQALSQLDVYTTMQQTLRVQTADVAGAMKKALLVADLLIQADGSLDLSSCSLVKTAFISCQPQEWEVNMGRVLDQLDTAWQSFFASVKAPTIVNQVPTMALKAMFSLSPSQVLTDRHAKVAVLAAMLSPYNQGPVGDCFAVTDMIRNHQEYYKHAAQDYASVVANGYIERPVDSSVDDFFFLPILADDDLASSCQLTSVGTFMGTSFSLLDAPGFAAACTVMGGQNLSTLTEQVMQQLGSPSPSSPVQTTPARVIAAMAKVIAHETPNSSPDALCAVGEYAFSSLTNNTVLRGVEAAFAAMAEDRPQDSTRGNINKCLSQALQNTWNQLKAESGIGSFQQTFMSVFDGSYRLVYNLKIPLNHLSDDGSSTSGGFQLYERIVGNPHQLGLRMATPQDFRQLVLDAIHKTVQQLGSTKEAQTIGNQLIAIVNTDDFLRNVLWDYDRSNQQEPNPVVNYERLSRTPMQSPDGDNPFAVDDIDLQKDYSSHVQTYTPSNTKDLISWCLGLAKTAPQELIPMDSPQHAFNFVPANPDMVAYIQKGKSPSQWLQNTLVAPGMQVSRKPISPASQKALSNTMYQMLAQALPDPTGYQQLVHKLGAKPISVRDYGSGLLKGINQLLHSNAEL
ncbi:MAG: hypothetical protein K2X08_05540, partial [Chlamydiales bacterium]|nr:hypothetical protein [Chlamydiales bacterium]